MSVLLNKIDTVPISGSNFDTQFIQWLLVLVDTLNQDIQDIQDSFNLLTAPNTAILTEAVTLTSGSPSFTVVNGALYRVGENVVGNGIPYQSIITAININTITISQNATINGASSLAFVPAIGAIGNGIVLYDTTQNVYVGMQNGILVKFTTTSYP